MSDPWIKSAVDRIERLEEERKAIGSDVRDVYGEVKDKGFNTKALRKIISERRQKDRDEVNDAMDGYRVALGMAAKAVRDGMSLDDATEEFGFSRSAIHRESQCQRDGSSGTAEEITPKAMPASILPCAEAWQQITRSAEAHSSLLVTQNANENGLLTHDSVSELVGPREMIEGELGDPLLVIDKERGKFRDKVRTLAAGIKPAAVEPVRAENAHTEIDLAIPAFLDQRKRQVHA